ncbi:MAG TPA: hypothetical protein VFQ79_18115 [Bryobacteraceae bacterium]|nr:hypothetical protein [Bryobacteraceae bacterium]
MIRDPELETAVLHFVETFTLVFDHDWDMTKGIITDPWYISPSGTFINPKVTDESNNWANRGALLNAYRNLLALLKERDLIPDFAA